MKSIALGLGLSEDASEAALLGAVTALKNRSTTLEAENGELKNRVSEFEASQIEADLEPLKNRVELVVLESFRGLLKNDRKSALPALQGLVKSLGPVKPTAPVYNRSQTKTPGDRENSDVSPDDGSINMTVLNRTRVIMKEFPRMSYHSAFRIASSEVASKS